jgi:hypothetical protein
MCFRGNTSLRSEVKYSPWYLLVYGSESVTLDVVDGAVLVVGDDKLLPAGTGSRASIRSESAVSHQTIATTSPGPAKPIWERNSPLLRV